MDFALQYLKHGKALCGSVFGTFVETFNRLVDFHANLKGDGDISADGRITVDRADPAHPVIRFDATGLSGGSSGGDDSGDDSGDDEDEATCVTSLNSSKGDMDVIGGEHIEVSTDGQTIKISYSESKEDEDPDPNAEEEDPCDHDKGGGKEGGVKADDDDDDESGGGGAGGGGAGGVPAEGGESHTGDDDCNCP